MQEITRMVCRLLNVAADDVRQITRSDRSDTLVVARIMSIKIIRERCRVSLTRIARFFNLQNHATMINALKRHEELYETSRAYRQVYTNARALLELDRAERELILNFYPFVYLNNIL